MILEYIEVIVITIVANFVLSKISGAFQSFGLMNAIAFGVAFSDKALSDLKEFYRTILEDREPEGSCMRFIQRARLWGQVFASLLHVGYALIFVYSFYLLFRDAIWIMALWCACVGFYAGTMARMSLWWIIKSIFVEPEILAQQMSEWQTKVYGNRNE
jgi:hypothetical protein